MNRSLPRIVLGLLSLVLFTSACNLNRAPIVWITDVRPQFVCPGDNVTLSWNGGDEAGCLGGGCSEVIVSISSDPADVLGSPLSGLRVRGETVAGPINGPTSFTFSATGGRDRRDPATHDVNVVLPDRETNARLGFAAECSGSSAVWHDADLSIPEFRAEGVRLVHVCNPSSHVISLTITFEFGSQRWTLVPGQCTEDLPPEVGRRVLSAHVTSLDLIGPPGTRCDTSSSLPPDLNLIAALACDLRSASMPIVAAPTETPTLEGTKSGIILLPTFTFTPESKPQLSFLENANCRKGPGSAYDVATSLVKGKLLPAVGRNESSSWWLVQIQPGSTCWVGDAAVNKSGPVEQLSIYPAPPLPEVPSKMVNSNVCDTKAMTLSVNLNWASVTDATGYNLYRNGSLLTTFGPGTTTYMDSAPLGVDLTYAVEALNGFGHSAQVMTAVPACK